MSRSVARLVVVFALLLLCGPVAGQVLWSATDEEGRQNWVLGTLHSEDPRLLEWPPELVEAMQSADRMALELVPDPAMLARLREAMAFGQGRLSEVMDEALFDQVVALLEDDYGMTESAVDRMRPWAVAMTLGTPPPETGLFMDLMLASRARGAGLEVVALETIDEQIDFLDGLEREDQIELIRETVESYDDYQAVFEELVAAYLDGDLGRLQALAGEQLADLPDDIARHFEQKGLVERNRRMLERAEAWLDSGGLIIAVGALHLPGEEGLIELLRRRGWRVEGVY